MKKVAVIQDISALGRCSLGAALPVLSVMGLQCCPVPTAVYTNQTGFSRFAVLDCQPLLREFPPLWKEHGVTLDGIYTGFMSSRAQLSAAQAVIDAFRAPHTLLLVDPVMGDCGEAYPGFDAAHRNAVTAFAAQADIITPNLTEACLMTGTDYNSFIQAPQKEQQASLACMRKSLPQPRVVITGWRCGDEVRNAAWEGNALTVYASPAVRGSFSGTGDLFASALCGGLVRGDSLDRSMRRALAFLEAGLRDAKRLNIPEAEGIPFEYHLRKLLP